MQLVWSNPMVALVAIFFFFSGIAVAYLWLREHNAIPDERLAQQVNALVGTIGEMQYSREKDRRDLLETKALLAVTQGKLLEANARIAHLEQVLQPLPEKPAETLPELLAIFGPDMVIAERDKRGLREAGVDYEALNDATRSAVSDEITARREDRRPLRLLHIGSHGSEHGIALVGEDGQDWVEPGWWRDTLGNVDVVMLSVCKGTKVANELAALTNYLVFFRDGVDNQDAAEFTGVFWSNIEHSLDPRQSYYHARRAVPGVRDFVSLRFRRPTGQ